MSCKICGRGNCVSSFHSIEEQEQVEEQSEKFESRMKDVLTNQANRLDGEYLDDIFYVKLDDVKDMIDNY